MAERRRASRDEVDEDDANNNENAENSEKLFVAKHRIGTKVQKDFNGQMLIGFVKSFDEATGSYRVRFTDHSFEEYPETDLDPLEAAAKNLQGSAKKKSRSKKKKKKSGEATSPARKRQRKETGDNDDDDDEDMPSGAATERNSSPSRFVGRSIKKKFDAEWFSGEVTRYRTTKRKLYYWIDYEDGDQEEMSEDELRTCLMWSEEDDGVVTMDFQGEESDIEEEKKTDDAPAAATTSASRRPSRRAARKHVNYADDNDDLDFSEEEGSDTEDTKPTKKRSRLTAATRKGSRRSRRAKQDDESDFEVESMQVDDDDDDEMLRDVVVEEDTSEDEATRAPARGAPKSSSAKKAKVSMAEAFEPIDNPLYSKLSFDEIQATANYLDPCGMEATDDVIDGLIGEQVDKVGKLLERAAKQEGEKIQLATACSGTDAPALALTLVKEQMEQRGLAVGADKDTKGFDFDHVFSCENEPFKQAYLARNFDSILYPDIAKLTDENPRDAFGQVRPLPYFNMFVAGTSCKNFSTMMTRYRIDIEDRGCSGETFLAATEVLFQKKPRYAIFENVISAPWDKMEEYITGRVELDNCSSTKAIKEIKDKKKDLIFKRGEKGSLIVHEVPSVYGVRCGSVVAGFLSPKSNALQTVSWPKKSTSQTCTLTDVIKGNDINKKTDTLVFETECVYCTHRVKVDTKDYGLPQTRQRVYLFVWRPDDDDVHDDLGKYWEAIVKHLRSPVKNALESFILRDDHEIIRSFREALRGPAGRQSRKGLFLQPDFWTSSDANLRHNKIAREKSGINDMTRSATSWGAFGVKHVPPHYWLEYSDMLTQRQLDAVDILHASAARDAESHDSNFSSFFWNLSQNVSKEKHRSARPGIAGCITPGGDVFLPHIGRPLLGCEKLLLQGIPYFRLALGNETEVQLGDLAGNAMSLTVVSSTMLAAHTCRQLRRETKASAHKDMMKILNESAGLRKIEAKDVKVVGIADVNKEDAHLIFQQLAQLAQEAVETSILCTCESSGRNSTTSDFIRCSICGVSCCRNCVGTASGVQLDSHATEEFTVSDHFHGHFQNKLRNTAPNALCFTEEGFKALADIGDDRYRFGPLANCVFRLHDIYRERKKWKVIYYARSREIEGLGEKIAEFAITIGELSRQRISSSGGDLGLMGELRSFLPARLDPKLFGTIEPCVVIKVYPGLNSDFEWKAKTGTHVTEVKVSGRGQTKSFRLEVGLNDDAAKRLASNTQKGTNKKPYAAARARGEARRWVYADNWKNWPEEITIAIGDNDNPICGVYKRAQCRQTANQSALWIREGTGGRHALYLLLKQNLQRLGPDVAVISSSISTNDVSSIVAVFPRDWQPCDAFSSLYQNVSVEMTKWTPLPELACFVVPTALEVTVHGSCGSGSLFSLSGLTEDDIRLLSDSTNESSSPVVELEMEKAQQRVRYFKALCVPPLMRAVASCNFFKKYIEWTPLENTGSSQYGSCPKTVPPRPFETWIFNKEREEWDRTTESGASRAYYLALQDAPRVFSFNLDKGKRMLTISCNTDVAAHHAAHGLTWRRGKGMDKELTVSYKLIDALFQADPVLKPFKVGKCDAEQSTAVALKRPFKLYERQEKAVTRLLKIERKEVTFEEIEMNETEMPGSTGYSLIAKASRLSKLRGGVIADAIGSGKTVVSIALILKGLEEARKSRMPPTKSSATLVVVPPSLINQWKDEINKFTTELEVILIFGVDTLEKTTLKRFLEADVVVCPIDILDKKGKYMANLMRVAQNQGEGNPDLPPYAGQQERIGAKGVWIPATSQDPYGGGNNKLNQQRRNQSARFTYVYSESIRKLRAMSFPESKKGVPLEYFEWERVIVDEIHESLCTTKAELDGDKFFTERNRRAGRELLGITERDAALRPLIFRRSIFGLTGTPLLDSTNRVIELANLMGNAYIIGLSSHWRRLEKESSRDIFLESFLGPKQSRTIRENMYAKCQEYLDLAAFRNRTGDEMQGIKLVQHRKVVRITEEEGELYKRSQSGIERSKQSYAITPEEFDISSGHDISKFLKQNSGFASRGNALVDACKEILEKDRTTKIIVFADGHIGAGEFARDALNGPDGPGCTWIGDDSVEERNRKIGWYQRGDASAEDKARPRVLILHFEQAAGLNLQMECYNMILFAPLYVGEGGTTSDPVSDASTELQAMGRVYRPGQPKPIVNLYRIEARGPDGEELLDGQLIRRNTDEETVNMAVNSGD